MTSVANNKITFWTAVAAASVFKLLFLKSYRSTDFEVHRNWLAITHSLPKEKWYYEDTSEWTLDYPPFFAYFEWILSHAAKIFDGDMLVVTNLGYASNMTVLFQKLSVIAGDFVLAYGVQEASAAVVNGEGKEIRGWKKSNDVLMQLFVLIFANGGLFLVDHIHFQYNGFLFGILILSMAKIIQGKIFQGAVLFAALLNFKHIFLYMAPAIGIYLFRKHCVNPNVPVGFRMINFKNLSLLGMTVISMFALSFGPFYQHIPQILTRLFPFKRGLCHAYWAPNIWAGYNTLDLMLNFVLKRGKSGATAGLVGESSFAVLPQVQPIHTFILTVIFMLPALWKVVRSPSTQCFIQALVLTAWTSFMFGYHVHEKAILNVIIPFALCAHDKPTQFFLTLVTGTVSLFPLLFTSFEIIIKLLVTVSHAFACSCILELRLRWYEIIYVIGFIPMFLFENLSHSIVPHLPFLPLLIMSDYCLLGIMYCYVRNYWEFLFEIGPQKLVSPDKTVRPTPSLKMSLRKRKPATS